MRRQDIREWLSEEYHSFWKSGSRKYLDRVERKLLRPLILPGSLFIDVGGGFGRLADLYRDAFTGAVIVDHSISMLEDARAHFRRHNIRSIRLVASNVCCLPFNDSTFNSGFMIRVVHHLEHPEDAVGEIHRILKPGARFILEFQNKASAAARMKRLIGRNAGYDLYSTGPVKIGELYWNFHPDHIRSICTAWFRVERELGGGILWNRNRMAALIPGAEYLDLALSRAFGRYHLTHQIFLVLASKKTPPEGSAPAGRAEPGLFRCVRCGGALESRSDRLACSGCRAEFPVEDGIYDFRDTAGRAAPETGPAVPARRGTQAGTTMAPGGPGCSRFCQ